MDTDCFYESCLTIFFPASVLIRVHPWFSDSEKRLLEGFDDRVDVQVDGH